MTSYKTQGSFKHTSLPIRYNAKKTLYFELNCQSHCYLYRTKSVNNKQYTDKETEQSKCIFSL